MSRIGGKSKVGYIEFENWKHEILIKGDAIYGRFSWQSDDKAVVFCNDSYVYFYRFIDQQLFTINIKSIEGYEGAVLAKGGFTNLTVSDDCEKVFFSIIDPTIGLKKDSMLEVEVWNGNDASLFPTQQLLQSTDIPKFVVWFPVSNKFKVLSDNSRFNVHITTGGNYVILSNPYTYILTSQYPKRVDYYIKDVRTGVEKLLLEQHPEEVNQLSFSPFDDSILYFQNENWWLYNPATDATTNITNYSNHCWNTVYEDDPSNPGAYGVASWTMDRKYVLLYDRFDIWKASLDGSVCVRLTRGSEKGIVYRINKSEFGGVRFRGYESDLRKVINLSKDMILEITNLLDWSTGYVVYNEKKSMRTLIYGPKKYNDFKKSINGKYLYTSETFSQPTQLEFTSNRGSKILFDSNRHQKQYYYGHSELVYYRNANGEILKGALFYPSNYKKDVKYPMVVKTYERLSGMLHKYTRPTLANDTGFNVSVFTTNGYFVLFPDIKHVNGSPGISAYDCVTSAVKEVIATYNVDEKHIGLIGHSFGGFETDFIITKTDLFAAAVSGAGIGNTIGYYFSLNTNGGGAEDGMWRFENQQMRMGIPFYQDKQSYLNNSPLYNAENIRTPLLQWTGKNDIVVPYEQSVNLYLALRKLKVKNVMLVYPEEGHSLSKETNQYDLTYRILQWFDYFLKGNVNIDWITGGTAEK
ncbi:S9 family peptidase [Flavobacterium capsici]|uniref:Prolyl oligopeptidase family serine peptidase n=1 Tax=Flavobacterium capsici TaxID=3075618 RepID=A0AA96EY74_9FLAO|nr:MULTISPECIES: prolyl oligopeptidase family serine peptidase [unclassified Flavobacterium]WNM19479.1 prolyl oligopeptidase family serine peptidase [Flavobacterium sp. PMR2A8]WNM20868.1 prolyl oligopeptidase family serine peptidase [Flavobacterium sp. PMTSA4]